jgi:hypothetical protein
VTSVVAIINNALNIIGASNIIDLNENTKTARVMNQMYENIRDDVFRAHPWNCLIRRAELAQEVTAPLFDYAHQYALPADPYCLRVLEFQNGSMTYPYENLVGQGNKPFFVIEGRKLLTDSGTARIKYVGRVTDATQYDAGLVSVLSARWRQRRHTPSPAQPLSCRSPTRCTSASCVRRGSLTPQKTAP